MSYIQENTQQPWEALRAAIDDLNVDQFLNNLSVIDQKSYRAKIMNHIDNQRHKSKHYWVYKNMDYENWRNTTGQLQYDRLLIAGPRDCKLDQVSSQIVDLALSEQRTAPDSHYIFNFFWKSGGRTEGDKEIAMIHTILSQFLHQSQAGMSAISVFLHTLFHRSGKKKVWDAHNSPKKDKIVLELLKSPPKALWAALMATLRFERGSNIKMTVIVDGFERRDNFPILSTFFDDLTLKAFTLKVLVTTPPATVSSESCSGWANIEYDVERKGNNTLYSSHPSVQRKPRFANIKK